MSISRRQFVTASASCASYLAVAAPFLTAPALRRWRGIGARQIVAQTPFARIEEVGEGMYAIISTPSTGLHHGVQRGHHRGSSGRCGRAFARRRGRRGRPGGGS